MNALARAYLKMDEALDIITILWAGVPVVRTQGLNEAVRLLQKAKGIVFKEAGGRTPSDQDAIRAVLDVVECKLKEGS